MADLPSSREQIGYVVDGELRRAAARRRLAIRRERILIVEAALAGRSQTLIARLAGVSQPHVSRILASVKRDNDGELRQLRLSAPDVIDQRDAGEIDNARMLEQLRDIVHTDGHVAHIGGVAVDAYIRGTWDDIEHAFYEDKLTFDEYSALFAAHRARVKAAPTDCEAVADTKQ